MIKELEHTIRQKGISLFAHDSAGERHVDTFIKLLIPNSKILSGKLTFDNIEYILNTSKDCSIFIKEPIQLIGWMIGSISSPLDRAHQNSKFLRKFFDICQTNNINLMIKSQAYVTLNPSQIILGNNSLMYSSNFICSFVDNKAKIVKSREDNIGLTFEYDILKLIRREKIKKIENADININK